MNAQAIRLAPYSHGAGCGGKISPCVLETLLHGKRDAFCDSDRLAGNETREDEGAGDITLAATGVLPSVKRRRAVIEIQSCC